MPLETQVSAGNGILLEDINGDRQLDILFTGNDFATEVFNGINDAGTGLIILNQGNRNWTTITPMESHFYNDGNTRGFIKYFDAAKKQFQYLVARHGNTPILHELTKPAIVDKTIQIPQNIVKIKMEYQDGTTRQQELYLGEGYKQQSSRVLTIDEGIKVVTGTSFTGKEMVLFGENI